MPYSSGTFSLVAGNPVVTGTVISSTTHNNTQTDVASGLSTCLLKDGTQTVTANIPMNSFRITGLGAATARTDSIQCAQVQDGGPLLIGSVLGTNTITGSLTPAITAYASGQRYAFVPANTNTGATTININSAGAKNVFWNGAACVGGELRANVPAELIYDGTQFHIIATAFNTPITQNSQSLAYTTVLTDAGKQILHPAADNNARTFTIDSNANVPYPIGTTLTFVNEINTVTIAITVDTLMVAGTGATGSRTLAASGMATAMKVTSTKWLISGPGLS